MEKSVIKKIIIEKQYEIQNAELVDRPLELEPSCNYVFTGVRRAGKSYFMYQYIKLLVKDGQNSYQDILFVNFEDERISSIKLEELDLLLESYREMFNKQPIIFFDEIQNISGWEKFVRRLADSKYRVLITGSNAKMLSREIHTTLGGRFVIKEIYPFSFTEYLIFKQVELNKNWEFEPVRIQVIKLFEEYFFYGGFAETFLVKDKRSWISSLYQKILLGDIIVRNNIRNDQALRFLVRKLAESVMQPSSLARLKNILISTGAQVSRNTVSDYLKYLEEAYLTFGISNFSDKLSEKESFKKRYFYDNGLLNNFLFDPEPKLLENLVAITLFKKFGDRLYYYNRNVEVDFFVPTEGIAIQVAFSLSNDDTKTREIKALHKLSEVHRLNKLLIITWERELIIKEKDLVIEVVPVWKWLINFPE